MTVVDFRASDTTTLQGKLRSRNGQAVTMGVTYMDALERRHGGMIEGQIAADGSYRYDGLLPGRYELTIALDTGVLTRSSFEIADGESNKTVDVTIPAGVLAGRVMDADGKAVAEADLVLEPWPIPARLRDATGDRALISGLAGHVFSDESGRFRLEGIAAGEYRVLYGKDGSFAAKTLRIADGEERSLTLRFAPGSLASMEIRAVDEENKPLRAAFVLRGEHGNVAELFASGGEPNFQDKLTGRVPPGRYRIYVTAPNRAPIHSRLIEIRGEPIVLRLERGSETVLRFDRGGKPVDEASVEILDADGTHLGPGANALELMMNPRAWQTDAQGRISAGRLADGNYTVRLDGKPVGEFTVAGRPLERRFTLPKR